MAIDDSQGYDLLDRLAEEFAGRYRRGERPALEEYVDRHPELPGRPARARIVPPGLDVAARGCAPAALAEGPAPQPP